MQASFVKIVYSQLSESICASQTRYRGGSKVVAELCRPSSGATGTSAASPSQHPGGHLKNTNTQSTHLVDNSLTNTPERYYGPPGRALCSATASASSSNALGFSRVWPVLALSCHLSEPSDQVWSPHGDPAPCWCAHSPLTSVLLSSLLGFFRL